MTLEELIDDYRRLTPKSKEYTEKASEILPSGVSANIKFFDPYPIFMEKADGAWLIDVDGNRYVDYLLSYGPLELGHNHPAILQAMQSQIEECGTILYGTPHKLEYEFAKEIIKHYPSIEMLRYTNSGTEATLLCLRLAYAYTGKYKIGKIEGHYHGGFNQVLLSVNPGINECGDLNHPNPVPESKGLEPYQSENTIVLPFNNLEACAEIIKEHKDEMAAIIMEPVLAGYIPATEEFMTGLRELTKELGIILIFDEVKTGFRSSLGGAQAYYGISPDLTALGKVIGGGMPMGIVGGKKEILMQTSSTSESDVFDITSKQSGAQNVVFHSGTYNGSPYILRIGLAVLEVLEKEYASTKARTTSLKEGITEVFKNHGVQILTLGFGTMFNYAITDKSQITTYRDMQTTDLALRKKIDFALFREGIYNKPTNRFNMSTVHDDSIIDFTLEAFDKALSRVL